MQTVDIFGKKFPLFLSVRAVEQIKERLGDVEETAQALESEESSLKTLDQSITLLAILMKEGAVAYNFMKNHDEPPVTPPEEAVLYSLVSSADIDRFTPAIVETFNEGTGRAVFSMPDNEKNLTGA